MLDGVYKTQREKDTKILEMNINLNVIEAKVLDIKKSMIRLEEELADEMTKYEDLNSSLARTLKLKTAEELNAMTAADKNNEGELNNG